MKEFLQIISIFVFLTIFLVLFTLFHRFFAKFELPLLAQSLVMNVTMFLMIHLCVKVRRNNSILKTRERVFTGKLFILAQISIYNNISNSTTLINSQCEYS